MTAVTIAIRYVSVAFNIYLNNKIGSVAMGLFTLISSVYGFALTLATSGISLATTKLVSEALGGLSKDEQSATVRAIMKKSIAFAFAISFTVSLALYLFSDTISINILKDYRTASALRLLSYTLVPIAVGSSISGYFIAIRKVHKNAAVQIFGQAIKIFSCIYLLSAICAEDVESACLAVVKGGTLAELVCFATHLISYLFDIRREKKKSVTNGSVNIELTNKLIPFTLPVAFSAYVRSALVTVEHLLIPWGLEKSGADRNASLSAYGAVHSIVFPFVLFPSAISSSFAGLLVPEISESFAANDNARIERIIKRVMKTVLIYSIGVAGVMMCLANEFGEFLFSDGASVKYIILVAPLIPVMYLDTSVDSILKGLGHQFYCMVINIVDALLSVILVWILLPRYGINGYIITVYFTELVNATLSITKLLLVSKAKFKIFELVAKPILSIIAATSILRFILTSSSGGYASTKCEVALHVIIIAGIYLFMLTLFRAISVKSIKRALVNFFKK